MKYSVLLFFMSFCMSIPAVARQDSVLNLQQQLPSNDVWWHTFGDTTLIVMIEKAIANNYDLKNAVKNVEMARSRWRIQKADYYPSIGVSAEYTPEKSSLGIDHTELYSHVGQAGLSMNWELDVFGSIRKNVKAQKENYLASQEDYRGAMVSLAAEVATAYIQLRAYQQQLEVARRNVKSQEEVLQINEAKLEVGLASSLTAAQSRGLLLQTKATIPGLEASIHSQANTLLLLTGEYSDSLHQSLVPIRPLPENTGLFVRGIPADLVRRRPDIRAAERTVEALAAAAGASRADWWPKFYVNGSIGFGNEYFKHFFEKENMAWQISPSVQWTIFKGRQIVESSHLARLQLDEGINSYNQTLLTALQEIDNAIYSYNKSIQQLEADREALEAIRQTFQYAMDLYQKGLSDYLSVLDSQRNVFNYEITLVDAESNALINLIQLYRAIGGGF